MVFAVGALYHLEGPESSTWRGAIVGAVIGLVAGIAMETGDYAPSVFLAIKVARALGVTVESLWGEEA